MEKFMKFASVLVSLGEIKVNQKGREQWQRASVLDVRDGLSYVDLQAANWANHR